VRQIDPAHPTARSSSRRLPGTQRPLFRIRRGDALPEYIEFNAVEEGPRLDHLAFALEESGIGVLIDAIDRAVAGELTGPGTA